MEVKGCVDKIVPGDFSKSLNNPRFRLLLKFLISLLNLMIF